MGVPCWVPVLLLLPNEIQDCGNSIDPREPANVKLGEAITTLGTLFH